MMDYKSQQKKAEKEQKQKYDLLIASWREALKHKQCREVIWDILNMTGLYADKNVGGDQTFVLLGRETIGLDILKRLEGVDKKTYPRLILEMNDG